MPRQPTGKPPGRPKGSGQLGEQTRLTVRIPMLLYERLQAFAEGRVYTRGAPQLAICVREALEEYLACRQTGLDNTRQTQNIPSARTPISRQTENGTTGYDISKYTLGKLCPRGHEHGTSGQSLLRISNRHCILCDREKFHERKQAKRKPVT